MFTLQNRLEYRRIGVFIGCETVTLTEKKELVLQMLGLYPSKDWYLQCLEMHFTASELSTVQNDANFLKEVQGVLFMEKQKLIIDRRSAMDIAASKGGWQGYDKLLQEIDRKLFSLSKDTSYNEGETSKTEIYIPENNR